MFSHGHAIKSLVAQIDGRDKETAWQIPIENTSITRIDYDGQFRVVSVNDHAHL